MNLATVNNADATCATWLETHGASWCHRLSATITITACEANRARSENKGTDYRCGGCGGLDNQPGPGLSFLPPVSIEDSEPDKSPRIENCEEEEIWPFDPIGEEPKIFLEEVKLSGFGSGILDLLETEAEELEPDRRPEPVQKVKRRVAVFMGRCRRCSGFMSHTAEPYDNAVYRCLSCGWRTSPTYEQNRTWQRQERRNN